MPKSYFKSILIAVTIVTVSLSALSQNSFVDYQKSFGKVADVFRRKEDTLRRQFEAKGLQWPAKYVYIRSFKYDSQLELWVKNNVREPFKLFKTYKVCAMAGSLGPKRMAGDYQVPEGFYYINEFNPNSLYHLSLGLNYPNASDKLLSDSSLPGGNIYIHGSCVTEGCIPITNDQIEELYIITSYAKAQGQDFIPVHIFPVKFNNPRSTEYLNRYMNAYMEYKPLVENLKSAYYYFEKNKQIPVVMISTRGNYITDDIPEPVKEMKVRASVFTPSDKKIPIPEDEIAKVVNKLPVYPGGNSAFQTFLNETGNELAPLLDEGVKSAYVLIEYVIDKQGKLVYAKVLKGGNDEINKRLEDKFESLPNWTPAVRLEQNVAIKLKQTIIVEAK
ncbi:MAG: hypothetical protein C5B52_05830 [Bacteroidetes bacterium]|nr:MAG: hypothetical protein C5B52_05830 [Bacteroidota bacterium]